ncbi:hypothetical protein T4E_5921 [Trichinella pseudospiralis]|uniref:Uncharacterized protein n=1 Tax=Trichinella pseudospiralis TaxID=6337 RepID=A0A0V1FY13_TRIPS|nr:hypothetical protein T4E_5921 [Trichinella pseudospiralis]KRY90841.1 hypothetical protein T4D_8631 [Trichinella pseudospiralis]
MTIMNPASYLIIACVACLAPLYCPNRHQHSDDDHPVTAGHFRLSFFIVLLDYFFLLIHQSMYVI